MERLGVERLWIDGEGGHASVCIVSCETSTTRPSGAPSYTQKHSSQTPPNAPVHD